MVRHPTNPLHALLIAFLLFSVGCSESDNSSGADVALSSPDSDGDSVSDYTDCAPNDPSAWENMTYFGIDGDGDGHYKVAVDTFCGNGQLPVIYSATLPRVSDCDDNNAQVWRGGTGYLDNDSDGFGTGPFQKLCVGGTQSIATQAGDCDDNQSSAWRIYDYVAIDRDRDGVGVNQSGQICIGVNVPQEYLSTEVVAGSQDCNDNDAAVWQQRQLFVDSDSDSYGTGVPLTRCVGQIPSGYTTRGNDCNDQDATLWLNLSYDRYDADGDGRTVTQVGNFCTAGQLPSSYYLQANTPTFFDCDDENPSIWQAIDLYADLDGDGFGAGEVLNACIGDNIDNGMVSNNNDCSDQDPQLTLWINYTGFDLDSDGKYKAQAGLYCSNGSLPATHTQTAIDPVESDCDDTNSSIWRSFNYQAVDLDADGYRISALGSICVAEDNPQNHFESSYIPAPDCNDNDVNVFQIKFVYQDADGDGYGAGTGSEQCVGNSPATTNESFTSFDCDDMDTLIWRIMTVYVDQDGDGIGAGTGTSMCIGDNPPTGYSLYGYDPVDTPSQPGSAVITELDSLPIILNVIP